MNYRIKSWSFTIYKVGNFHILPSLIIGYHDDGLEGDGWYITGSFIRWIWIVKKLKYQIK